MRMMCILAVTATLATADDLGGARDKIARYDAAARREAIAILVQANSRAALDVLVDALRRAHRDDERRTRPFEKALEAALREMRQVSDEMDRLKTSRRGRDKLDDLMRRAAAARQAAVDAGQEFEPHRVLVVDGAAALGRFESADAITRLWDVARPEPTGPLRLACLAAALARSASQETANASPPRRIATRACGLSC